MRLTRRDLLRVAGGAALAGPLAACDSLPGNLGNIGDLAGSSTGALLKSDLKLPDPFGVPLPVPAVLKPTRTDGTTDYYDITQRRATVEIIPGHRTEIWGYNGTFPGPTIASRSGRRTVVRHRNELPVPVVVHLHGGRNPAEHDGYPIDYLLPTGGWSGGTGHSGHGGGQAGHVGRVSQGTKDYVYPLDQPAATLWYHDHRMDFTGPQVWRGLAGFHLLHDDIEDDLPLPKGDKDIPLMICDRSFNEDGSLRYPAVDPSLAGEPGVTGTYMNGVLGDTILVNGAPWPYLEVSNTRYRFRVLNASNARRYKLRLDPAPGEGPSFVQVGSDLGLLGAPIGHQEIEIAQAERFDVVIDFSTYPIGTEVTLANGLDDGPTGRIMRFRVTRRETDASTVPAKLAEVEPIDGSSAAGTRSFLFSQGVANRQQIWTINGKPFDPDRADATARLGSTEIWKLTSDVHHPVHLHLAHFQVLRRQGRAPRASDAGWKDTVDLRRGEVVEVAARFTGHTGRYVFHCHNLEHEDMVMMGNLDVV
ncbi:multicopper oxidase family protein [Plantactinospora sp. GCM10030261]|uniref:multicopper oxidase family protein n=1 Tax=Plantactinospora sp. GCM10030261 TaxID=3273420 RepID=UPI003623907A